MTIYIPEVGVKLSDNAALALWQVVSNFPLPFGEDYLHYKLKWGTSYAALALSEYRKFAFLAMASASEITPSESIDEVWHIHILHTESYQKFASDCGQFLHHWPGMPNQRRRWSNQYIRTIALYESVFKQCAPLSHWPRQGTAMKVVTKLNRVLALYDQRTKALRAA